MSHILIAYVTLTTKTRSYIWNTKNFNFLLTIIKMHSTTSKIKCRMHCVTLFIVFVSYFNIALNFIGLDCFTWVFLSENKIYIYATFKSSAYLPVIYSLIPRIYMYVYEKWVLIRWWTELNLLFVLIATKDLFMEHARSRECPFSTQCAWN